ncbi:BZ3500_MvSof-1268-A1-R1_Chr2-1g04106 [Microbotryum saponariae]|uniref:Aminopeptidase n=1 Tax=Microbotryum saponariae TaxID=289078 RepID=A0A2X0K699_9BASI|nr:BZ3500_MvSof-1268-A1-R1_Chr2-1g04106 [Microbotryum saponariae]SCZ91093.1 BZ3501_MvSof-1269-A2-R1_Chr2-1g03762 [Microbotryum saponariae]
MSLNNIQVVTSSGVGPDDVRLTSDVTDLKNLTFSGTAEITLDVLHETASIVLHVAESIQIKHAVLSHGRKSSNQPATKFRLDTKRERVEIFFEGGKIVPGQVRLGLRWESNLGTTAGYYRSTYPAPGGQEGEIAYYAITQFQPTAARRAFPCFDEPALKATFAIQMISRTDSISLSNMDVIATKHLGAGGDFPRTSLLEESFFTQDGPAINTVTSVSAIPAQSVSHGDFKDDWSLITFATLPKVSTYLVAFANGPFAHLESTFTSTISGKVIPLRVYATADCVEQGALTLETMAKILPLYEKLFDVEYPLPKLDSLIATDCSGAMENWGLIIGVKDAYVYDPAKSSIKNKKKVVVYNSHEVAHQWFGNIVTFDWWDGLWLNEAFATLVGEVLMLDEIEPSWRVHSGFVKQELAEALRLDALPSSHPIQVPCPDEATIGQIFDAISYYKGASVLKMLSNFIGQERFIRGVSIYLKRFLYGNTVAKDLWDGISEASGKDVATMMENWTLKVGYPVVTVKETVEGLKVRQNRFISTRNVKAEEDEVLWHIPLQLLVVRDGKTTVNHDLLLTKREMTIPLQDVANTTYKLNASTCGVYRTSYPKDRLVKIGQEAGKPDTAFDLSDRMGLVGDAMALAIAGVSKTSTGLSFLSELRNEKENLVLQAVADSLATLASTWWEQPKEVRDAISKLRRTLFGPIAERLGFDDSAEDDVDTVELRATAITTAAAAEDPQILAEYQRRFTPFLEKNDESLIPSELQESIYAICVEKGGEKEFEKMVSVFRAPETPDQAVAAVKGMSATQDQERLERVFEIIKREDTSINYIVHSTRALSMNPFATRALWRFFQENYDYISRRFEGSLMITAIVPICFARLTTEADVLAVEKWAQGVDSSAFSQALDQGLDRVRLNAKWLERDAGDVEGWLRESGYFE